MDEVLKSKLNNILIISDFDTSEIESAVQILQQEKNYTLSVIQKSDAPLFLAPKLEDTTDFSCVIFYCKNLDETEFVFLRSLSAQKILPLLIMSHQINIYSYSQVHLMENMFALQSPCDPKLLLTMIEKICAGESIKPDRCPRFITNEPVRLVVLRTGHLVPTRMRNYSAGGAFLEYRGIAMQVGDRIQLNLGNSKTRHKNDQFLLEGKVVWIREGDHSRSAARGVGIQFTES